MSPAFLAPPVALNRISAARLNSQTTLKAAFNATRPRAHSTILELPPSKRSVKSFGRLTAVVATIAAVAAFQPWKSFTTQPVSEAGETVEFVRTVKVDHPTPASTTNVVLPATIRPWQTTTLVARASGYLAAWHYDLGARVHTGDVLAEIATPELDQEVNQAAALWHEAVAAAQQARAERVEAEADLKVAEAQLVRIQAESELSKSQLGRREKLLVGRSVSQEEFETAQRQVEARGGDVAAAESDIVRRRSNLDTRTAIIEAREATANSRKASFERLKELQGFKRIVAPFGGVVTRRAAEVGMLVTAGQEPLFVVEDRSRVRVQLSVPQTYAAQTLPGVSADINLPESGLGSVRGAITRVADSVDATNRTMLAEIELDNAAYRFQPGSYAQVTLTTPQDHSSWTIPTNTLSMRVQGPHVAVVGDDDQITLRPVRLGRDLGNRVVVTEGIRGNEVLVINPGDDLISGVRVRIDSGRETDQEVAKR